MSSPEAKIEALMRVAALLEASEESAWASQSPAELRDEVLELVARLEAGKRVSQRKLRRLFAPTGALQEIAVDNGWGEELLELALSVV